MTLSNLSQVHLSLFSPSACALVDDEERLSYEELERRVSAMAGGLVEAGIRPGQRIAVRCGQSADFVVAHLGILRAGAVSVPIPLDASTEQTRFMVEDADVTLIVQRSGMRDDLGVSAATVSELTTTAARLSEPVSADDLHGSGALASLMYTTGTAGRPKAVMLSHANTIAALSNIRRVVAPQLERELITLPIHHSFGLGQVYATLLTGGTAILHPGLLRLRAVLDLMIRERVTSLPGTPSTFRLLLDRGGSRFLEAAEHLRLSVINSSPLSPAMARELLGALPAVRFVVYYGLTEASRSTFLHLREASTEQLQSVGTAAPDVRVSVLDESGQTAAAGAIGEVTISGPTVALGYWRRPDETDSSFRSGQLFTGDIGWLTKDGFLVVRGRTKDQINVGGHKVSPSDVERVLAQHSAVSDCAVVGMPDDVTGEQVVAAIVPTAAGAEIDEAALAGFCSTHLQPFELPRRWVVLQTIPKTETGKVLRNRLREVLSFPEC